MSFVFTESMSWDRQKQHRPGQNWLFVCMQCGWIPLTRMSIDIAMITKGVSQQRTVQGSDALLGSESHPPLSLFPWHPRGPSWLSRGDDRTNVAHSCCKVFACSWQIRGSCTFRATRARRAITGILSFKVLASRTCSQKCM
jgi:hypothetical protein